MVTSVRHFICPKCNPNRPFAIVRKDNNGLVVPLGIEVIDNRFIRCGYCKGGLIEILMPDFVSKDVREVPK